MKAKRLPLACLPLLCCPLAGCAPEEADDGMATITFVLTVHVTLEGEFEPYDYLAGDLFRTEMDFQKGYVPSLPDTLWALPGERLPLVYCRRPLLRRDELLPVPR